MLDERATSWVAGHLGAEVSRAVAQESCQHEAPENLLELAAGSIAD